MLEMMDEQDSDDNVLDKDSMKRRMKDKDWKMNRHVSNCDVNNYREMIYPERLLNVDDH